MRIEARDCGMVEFSGVKVMPPRWGWNGSGGVWSWGDAPGCCIPPRWGCRVASPWHTDMIVRSFDLSRLIRVQELVGVHQCVAEVGQRRGIDIAVAAAGAQQRRLRGEELPSQRDFILARRPAPRRAVRVSDQGVFLVAKARPQIRRPVPGTF